MKASEFDRKFGEGKDIDKHLDWTNAVRGDESALLHRTRRVNVDFPEWMLIELDREAARLGINRQAVIKTLLDEGLKRHSAA